MTSSRLFITRSFRKPAAHRKLGVVAYKNYAIGLILAALWIVFISIPWFMPHYSTVMEHWAVSAQHHHDVLDFVRNLPATAFYDLRFLIAGFLMIILFAHFMITPKYGALRLPLEIQELGVLFVLMSEFILAGTYALIVTQDPAHVLWPPASTWLCAFIPCMLITLPTMLRACLDYVREHPAYRQFFVFGKGPASRWGGIYTYLKYDFSDWPRFIGERAAPIFMGYTFWFEDYKIGGRKIGLDSDSMMMTVGAIGGGKSLYAAWNTLLSWRGGLFVLDPKGEHAMRSLKARQALTSKPCHVIDPWGEVKDLAETACFNPLDGIDINSPNALDDINQIVMANIFQEGKETGNSAHFRQNGQKIMRGIIAHVLTAMPEDKHNLPAIYDIILTGTKDGIAANREAFMDLIVDMSVNDALGKAPMDAAKVLEEAGENERGGFITTLATGLSWVNTPSLRPILTHSTMGMDRIKQNRETLYLVVPFEHMAAHKRFLRTLISIGLISCRHEADHHHKTLFMLDEFAQLGTFVPIKEGLVTLRSRGVKIWLFLQTLGQLKERYENYSDFMASCDKQFFAIEAMEDAQEISKILGDYTEKWADPAYRELTKPLRPPSQVREELRKGSGVQYVLPTNGLPMMLKLSRFDKEFRMN